MTPTPGVRMTAREEAARAMTPMLAEIAAVMHLPDDDPRRVAAIAEKHRVLALIAESERGLPA